MKNLKNLLSLWGLLLPFAVGAQNSAYEVAAWAGFRSSAITFTFDDCLANQYKTAVPLLNQYGMKGSFYVVTNWIGTSSSYYSWADASAMAAAGHEVGSHTVSHADLNGSDYEYQMSESKSIIESHLGQTVSTLVYPDCISPASESVAAQYYIGGRICNGQIESSSPSNFFQIGSLICGSSGFYNSLSAFQSAFSSVKSKGGWAVFLIHELDNGSGYSPLSSSVFGEALSYLSTNDSSFWVTTFGNAIRYSKERDAAQIAEVSNSDSVITLSVSDNLENSTYAYPLSLRRILPSGWTSVRVSQGDTSYAATVANGYIYFQAVPDGGVVSLSSADASSGSSDSTSSGSSSVTLEGGYTGPSCDGDGSGAYFTGVYKNLFTEVLGKSEAEVQSKIEGLWSHFFTAGSSTSVYYEDGSDRAYIYDTGNQDVRTEGMSYGMMICVQLNHQTEFNKLWRWAKKYMQYQSGDWEGYFAWQCGTDGTVKGTSCAPDGEEYFITALLFAANRWGSDGEINYNDEAQNILSKIMNKSGNGGVYNMFDASTHLVTFVPYYSSAQFSDPSYNLPAFLELWARWSDTNNSFWAQAALSARTLLQNSCHSTSGLFPDYCTFAGQPTQPSFAGYDTKQYKYDAIRCAMNVGMDFNWFRSDSAAQVAMMTRLCTFFQNDGYTHGYFDWDGSNATGSYSEGIAGANGVGCFALADASLAKTNLQKLWNMSAPTGQWRYYNGMVYFLSMLHVSGNFKIYKPVPVVTDTTVYNSFAGVTYQADTTFLSYFNCKVYRVQVLINKSSLPFVGATASVDVSPNPSSDGVQISAPVAVESVRLCNALGRVVLYAHSASFSVAQLPAGVYVLYVSLADGSAAVSKLCVH